MKKESLITFAVHTLGCKVNYTETSSISDQFVEKGFKKVNFKDFADIYIINSCVLTSSAEKKTRNAIYKAHRTNPNAKIAVIGCVSELFSESLKQIEGVSFILGNDAKFFISNFIENISHNEQIIKAGNIDNVKEFRLSYSLSERTRSFLKIQDGCNCFCNYCIVPYARGRSRSAKIDDVLKAVDKIAQKGYKEIVLTGINLGDFGKDSNETLIKLLDRIIKTKTIQRIRLSSIEPKYITKELLEFYASHSEMMPHFHIPMQSACDTVLQRMGRDYNTVFLSDIIAMIIKYLPNAFIAADVIVGFPGETDDEFKQSFEFFKNNPIAFLHVFTFSARKGTAAYSMSEQVHPKIKKQRATLLSDLSTKNKIQFYNSQLNKCHKILIEVEDNKGNKYGHTENFIKVKLTNINAKTNKIVEVVPTIYDEESETVEAKPSISELKTLIIGASPNTYRYSYKAVVMLIKHGFKVEAFGTRKGEINGVAIQNNLNGLVDIHTVSLYINPNHQKNYIDYIVNSIKPKRIIFNPGTENHEFAKLATSAGIEVVNACTLVMLATNTY